ncbi:MAG: hypothetical protein WA792_07420 [Pseudolabrys sp.]
MRITAIAAAALFLGTAGAADPALTMTAQARDGIAATTQLAAASTKHHRKARRHIDQAESGGQIACTPIGCGRIPRNCHPTTAYYPDGTPTGYDAVACR